jgi:hypothetical protein
MGDREINSHTLRRQGKRERWGVVTVCERKRKRERERERNEK